MKHAMALTALAVALVACAEKPDRAAHEARSLEQMLALGANEYLIAKYEEAGRETALVLRMLEAIGRDGPEKHVEYVEELRARGFAIDRATAEAARSWIVERRPI